MYENDIDTHISKIQMGNIETFPPPETFWSEGNETF